MAMYRKIIAGVPCTFSSKPPGWLTRQWAREERQAAKRDAEASVRAATTAYGAWLAARAGIDINGATIVNLGSGGECHSSHLHYCWTVDAGPYRGRTVTAEVQVPIPHWDWQPTVTEEQIDA